MDDVETDNKFQLSTKIDIFIPELSKVHLLPHISPGQWDT